MGLLDDAIREHLELKRRRGADPGEVAREQHEALDPVEREALEASDDRAASAGAAIDEQPPARHYGEVVEPSGGGSITGGAGPAMPDELADVAPPAHDTQAAGETAELDMRTVLGDDLAPTGNPTPGVAGGVRPAPVAGAPLRDDTPDAGDSLEWEMPGEEHADAEPDDGEPDEDVLEETPEFLRDTPEQDRLWFEQRPPRDFDFDK